MPESPSQPTDTTLWTSHPSRWSILLRPLIPILSILALTLLILWAAADFLSPVAVTWLAILATLFIAAILVWSSLARDAERFTLTHRRLIWESGILRRLRIEAPLPRVQNTVLLRSLRERLFNLGTLAFATAGTDGYEIVWSMIPRPHDVLAVARSAIDRSPQQQSPVPIATPIIGLAGGIGSGKSEVARILASRGCTVLDSDNEAHALLEDPAIQAQLTQWWGDSILGPPDERGYRPIDRAAISKIVFNDPEQRTRLESLIHPRLKDLRQRTIARLRAQPHPPRAIIIDAPLLFEAGVDAECDAVIFVDAPLEQRVARVRAARGWDAVELYRRESAQLPLDEKRRRSKHIITNSTDLPTLESQIHIILATIVADPPPSTT